MRFTGLTDVTFDIPSRLDFNTQATSLSYEFQGLNYTFSGGSYYDIEVIGARAVIMDNQLEMDQHPRSGRRTEQT